MPVPCILQLSPPIFLFGKIASWLHSFILFKAVILNDRLYIYFQRMKNYVGLFKGSILTMSIV